MLALAAVLTACADEPGTDEPGDDAGASGSPAAAELTITVDPGDGRAVQEYTLACTGGPQGTLPDPRAACDHLATLDEPFAPLPADAVCTEQYGGPQTARVVGTWAGEPVDLALSRTDGCRISQWDSLGPLLPAR